jgi:protein tyrosine phosphatase
MIWENKSTLMIMVCPCTGPKGGEESYQYWNNLEKVGDETTIGSHFTLKLLQTKSVNEGRIIHRQIELTLIGSYGKK